MGCVMSRIFEGDVSGLGVSAGRAVEGVVSP